MGPDQKVGTKEPYNWSPGLILGAFCTIFRARPVGTGPGAKLGRKPSKNQITNISLIYYSKRSGGIYVPLLLVLRFCVDPGIARDGRGTSFPALGIDSGPGEGVSEGVRGAHKPDINIIFIVIQTSATYIVW